MGTPRRWPGKVMIMEHRPTLGLEEPNCGPWELRRVGAPQHATIYAAVRTRGCRIAKGGHLTAETGEPSRDVGED